MALPRHVYVCHAHVSVNHAHIRLYGMHDWCYKRLYVSKQALQPLKRTCSDDGVEW